MDAKGLADLEEEWRRNPRTASFYALASRYFETGRTQDAYEVLRAGLAVHQAHAAARELLLRVTEAMDSARGSRPGNAALARMRVKSGVRTPVEERVSQRVAARHNADSPTSKVARHKPPPENPFASDPGDGFPPPAATPPPMTPESLQVLLDRKKGATTVPRRRGRVLLIAAVVVLLAAPGVAAYLVFQPF